MSKTTKLPIILLVDDFSLVRATLKELLLDLNYLVIEASNGKEAVEEATRLCPDIIVMDINMPILDGFSAARQIRTLGGRYQTVPILAFSTGGEMRDAAMNAGFSEYFDKNEISPLISAIERILNR